MLHPPAIARREGKKEKESKGGGERREKTEVGPPERDKTDRSQELNDGLGEALARRLNGIY